MKKKSLIKPRSVSEVIKYEKRVGEMLYNLIIKKLNDKNKDVDLSWLNPEHLFKPEKAFINTTDESIIKDAKSGKKALLLNLDPIMFNSSLVDSGVPYLKVSVTSWLNKESTKTLFHRLLSLVKK